MNRARCSMRARLERCILYNMVSYPLIRLAQLVERQSHGLVVVGSSPTSDILCMVGSIQLRWLSR